MIHDEHLQTPVAGTYDVIVAGAGPAGVPAAITAARRGARVLLIEAAGCLGGVWTAGMLTWVFDVEHTGFAAELAARMPADAYRPWPRKGMQCFSYDVEAMKRVLEDLCCEAGIDMLLHTRVVHGIRDGRRLRGVVTESCSGRQAWRAAVCIDATGNGDLAARAGCGFDMGSPEGDLQPATMMAAITVPDIDAVAPYIAFYVPAAGKERPPWQKLTDYLMSVGIDPSYHASTLFQLRGNLLALMVNHQYGMDATDAASVTQATLAARREINDIVDRLSAQDGPFRGCQLVATAEHIGIRDARRIHGRYQVTADDLARGARFDDGVCRVRFNADVHSPDPSQGKGFDPKRHQRNALRFYDIPLRSLISKDLDGLLMAGRCISGDWIAHASYRVTGEAISMGEAAGILAAVSALTHRDPHEVPYAELELIAPPERNT